MLQNKFYRTVYTMLRHAINKEYGY